MSFDIDISEEAGVRYLHFGSDWVQGAMRIARPWSLELDYTRELMAPLLLRPDARWPKDVLVIGLGAGSVLKFLHRHRPEARLTVVEIEPRVVAAARHHFKLPEEDARFHIEIGDGYDYVQNSGRRFDLILVDGFDPDGRAGVLDTLPFYLNCRARLADDGLLGVNLLSRRKDFRASVARIREAFGERALAFPSCDSGNAIAVAAVGETVDQGLEELKQSATALRKTTGLNLLPTLARLALAKSCSGGRLML
ncbi:MAG TPA: fused MFS/spermidine synthase [Rhodocyclaceae bacterium]